MIYMKLGKINFGKNFENRRYRSSFHRNESAACNSNASNISGDTCQKNNCSDMGGNCNGGCGCSKNGWYNPQHNAQMKSTDGSPMPNSWRDNQNAPKCTSGAMRDRGNEPIVFDIRKEAYMTPDFRTALWTGGNLQLVLMTIPVGEEIGVERHEGIDQLIGVISGTGEVVFGNRENFFAPPLPLDAHSVILIPSGTYHNVKNVGMTPLKLYSVYAPKAHKFGTVDKTKAE